MSTSSCITRQESLFSKKLFHRLNFVFAESCKSKSHMRKGLELFTAKSNNFIRSVFVRHTSDKILEKNLSLTLKILWRHRIYKLNILI
jgi:hypothetical protein